MISAPNIKIKDNNLVLDNEAFNIDCLDIVRILRYGNINLGHSLQVLINGGQSLNLYNYVNDKNQLIPQFMQIIQVIKNAGFKNFAIINSTCFVNMDHVNKIFAIRGNVNSQDCICIELNSGRRLYVPTDSLEQAQEQVVMYAKQHRQYMNSEDLQL